MTNTNLTDKDLEKVTGGTGSSNLKYSLYHEIHINIGTGYLVYKVIEINDQREDPYKIDFYGFDGENESEHVYSWVTETTLDIYESLKSN